MCMNCLPKSDVVTANVKTASGIAADQPHPGKPLIAFADLTETEQFLVEQAWAACPNTHSPYSKFPVGAAILAQDAAGNLRVFQGTNMENASYGGTICAERTACGAMNTAGFKKILMVAVVCAKVPGGSPCGFCRQVIREFGKDAVILNVSNKESAVVRWTMDQLLPDSFGPESL